MGGAGIRDACVAPPPIQPYPANLNPILRASFPTPLLNWQAD